MDTGESNIAGLSVLPSPLVGKVLYQGEWWFSVPDVIQYLTDSVDAPQYIKKLRQRDVLLNSDWGTICTPLQMVAKDGKTRQITCTNTKGLFRIIQSIPSPKAEPFKRWLAQVGHDRIQEIENPEIATQRTRALYKAKGYSDDWIEKRMRSIAIREELTEEWDKRGVKTSKEFAILTAEISKATFGVTPSEHKKVKGTTRENLRDHMTDLELIFGMLGEASTTAIARSKNAQGFMANKQAALEGGQVAGVARKKLEMETGKKVVSDENYLPAPAPRPSLK